ncbi:hypothetical protein LAZ67_21000827 [Cordylochernes scorpioides]|uniref:CCHC-type domain-containing protein n=1 Tax=Cordylochernes scorpioides TaxID=51811 RepID=A0ABY6LNC9_9ARAC|nr:hypothetical protein LAZ67_21000827 [Cordylochernes scorpioides]
MAYEVVTCEGYSWTTGSREASVLLNEGRKLHQLPTKLVIISKGESTPAYITYGVRCSKCHRQGHRRATCPLGAPQSRPALLQDNQNWTAVDNSILPAQVIAKIRSAYIGCTGQKSSVNTPAPAPTITTAASPPAVSDHPAPEAASVQRTLIPTVHKDKTPETAPSTSIPETSNALTEKPPRYAVDMVEELFYKLDSRSVLRPLGYETETAVWAVFSSETREEVLVSLTPEEKIILAELLDRAIASIGDSDHFITQKLSDFKVACEAQFQTSLH